MKKTILKLLMGLLLLIIPYNNAESTQEPFKARCSVIVPEEPETVLKQPYIKYGHLIGKKYKYGSSDTNSFDCSSLIKHIYETQFDTILPRTSRLQSDLGVEVSLDSIKVGDLLFYNRTSRGKPSTRISHVAIYVGKDIILHSVSKGIRIDSVSRRYYKDRLVSIRHIIIK